MKKVIPDPLDNYYNYAAITDVFTRLSPVNQDMAEMAEKEINDYIESMKKGNNINSIKALGLSMRLATDSDFKIQMIEANFQYKAVLATLDDNDNFFNDYLFPKIKEMAEKDYRDTREYRLYQLENFSLEEFQKELSELFDGLPIEFNEKTIINIKERIETVKNYFLISKIGE